MDDNFKLSMLVQQMKGSSKDFFEGCKMLITTPNACAGSLPLDCISTNSFCMVYTSKNIEIAKWGVC